MRTTSCRLNFISCLHWGVNKFSSECNTVAFFSQFNSTTVTENSIWMIQQNLIDNLVFSHKIPFFHRIFFPFVTILNSHGWFFFICRCYGLFFSRIVNWYFAYFPVLFRILFSWHFKFGLDLIQIIWQILFFLCICKEYFSNIFILIWFQFSWFFLVPKNHQFAFNFLPFHRSFWYELF